MESSPTTTNWEDDSDSDDSLIMSFQHVYLNGATSRYSDTDVLLDTGSTVSVIKNRKMLINAKNSEKTLRAFTNGGHQDSTMDGDFPGFFKVWFNPESRLNILSFKDVRQRFRVTVDTAVESAMCVHMDNGKILKFVEVESGLYLLKVINVDTKQKISAYSFLTLVKANRNDFTKRQLIRADKARSFCKKIGYPGYKKYFKLLEKQYFQNCPITVEDAKTALHIYGPDIEGLKGKKVRQKPDKITEITRVNIPDTIKDLHPNINLSADFFLYKE